MIGKMYVYEKQDHGDLGICHLIMEVKTSCFGVEHFEKICVDYADTEEEAIDIVNHMNAHLQAH